MKKLCTVLFMTVFLLMTGGGQLPATEDPLGVGGEGSGGGTDLSHPWGGDGIGGGGPIDVSRSVPPSYVTGIPAIDILLVKYYSVAYAREKQILDSRTSTTSTTTASRTRTSRGHILKKRVVR